MLKWLERWAAEVTNNNLWAATVTMNKTTRIMTETTTMCDHKVCKSRTLTSKKKTTWTIWISPMICHNRFIKLVKLAQHHNIRDVKLKITMSTKEKENLAMIMIKFRKSYQWNFWKIKKEQTLKMKKRLKNSNTREDSHRWKKVQSTFS